MATAPVATRRRPLGASSSHSRRSNSLFGGGKNSRSSSSSGRSSRDRNNKRRSHRGFRLCGGSGGCNSGSGNDSLGSVGRISHAGANGSNAREKGSTNSRNSNRCSEAQSGLDFAVHGGDRVVAGGSDSLRSGESSRARTLGETGAGAVGVVAPVLDVVIARLGPDVEVLDGHVGAGHGGWAVELDGPALVAVGAGSLPVGKGKVGVEDAVAVNGRHGRPGGVEVERVGVGVAGEAVEDDVGHGAAAAVGLEHEHLVGTLRVHVAVRDVVDVCVPLVL